MNKIKSIFEMIDKVKYMLTKKQKRLSIFVLFLIVVGSFLETLGVTAILPFIKSILTPEDILNKWYVQPIVWICGSTDEKTIMIAIGVTVIVIYFIKNIYMYFATVYQSKYRGDIQKYLSVKMLRSYMSWPYEDFSSLNTAKITQGIDTDVVGVYNLLDNFFRFISEFLTAALIVYYFDSIWVPIIAHTTWNFTQNIVLGLPNSGIVFPVSVFKLDAGANNFAFDSTFGVEGSILSIILHAIVCVGLYYFGRKKGEIETNIWNDK